MIMKKIFGKNRGVHDKISSEIFKRLIENAKNKLHIEFYISHQETAINEKDSSWFD